MNQLEREEIDLDNRLDAGELSVPEYNTEMCQLQRDYHAAAEQAARQAYEEELDRW